MLIHLVVECLSRNLQVLHRLCGVSTCRRQRFGDKAGLVSRHHFGEAGHLGGFAGGGMLLWAEQLQLGKTL